ncbi:acyl dehydratase [Amorphus suaedae]
MLTVDRPADLKAHAGSFLGQSGWRPVTQADISAFAELTGDDHWIHVDTARAAAEMPDGKTIAHGLFLLALVPRLQRELYAIRHRGSGLNYGYEKVRFLSPVPVDSRIRLALTLVDVSDHPRGTRIVTASTIELEHSERPALVADHIILVADPS